MGVTYPLFFRRRETKEGSGVYMLDCSSCREVNALFSMLVVVLLVAASFAKEKNSPTGAEDEDEDGEAGAPGDTEDRNADVKVEAWAWPAELSMLVLLYMSWPALLSLLLMSWPALLSMLVTSAAEASMKLIACRG